MKFFLLLFLGFLQNASAASKMRFTYETAEGTEVAPCAHEQIQDLPDWRVYCETSFGKKEFTAHVIIREVSRKESVGLEILYWVSEPAKGQSSAPRFHSTTALMSLKGNARLSHLSLSQGIENDFASLVLAWSGDSD